MNGQITGRHVLIGLIAFFGIVIGVNIVFVTSAVRSFPGEATKKSYVQGINYNDTLEQKEKQKALGWSAEIGEMDIASQRQLVVRISDADSSPVSTLAVVARLSEHSDDHNQLDFTLLELDPGEYSVELPQEIFGRWTAVVTATGSDELVFETQKTMVFK